MKIQFRVLLLIVLIGLVPVTSNAAQVEETPGAFTMMADMFVARPLGLALLAVSSVAYVATLPFSLFGGNSMDSAKTLVIGPAREVFIRCLGCRRVGRKERIRN